VTTQATGKNQHGTVQTNNQPDQDLWTVSELTRYVRELFEIDYRLQDLR
jgi:hypothetical protein